MFTFKALIDITAFKRFFAHGIATLRTFFVHRFKVGDEFTLRIVHTTKEFTSFPFSLLKFSSTFRTRNGEFFRRLKRFCIFTFWVRGTGKEFTSFRVFDDHHRTTFFTLFVCLFRSFYFCTIRVFRVFTFREVAACDKFAISPFTQKKFRITFRTFFSCRDGYFKTFDIFLLLIFYQNLE